MKYVQLGKIGIDVGRLGLGTMNFGVLTDERECGLILDCAVDNGINFLDTADIYGWKLGEGITEQILGRWLRENSTKRDKIILATKAFGETGCSTNDRGASAYHLKAACEASLKRLGTDHIDLYQLHHLDRRTTWHEIWQATDQLVREGKILYVGSSNLPGWQIATASQIASNKQILGLASEQSPYNLMTRTVELEVLPACQYYGLGFLAWGPLAGGLLGGSILQGDSGRRQSPNHNVVQRRHAHQLERFYDLCKGIGAAPSLVSVSWLLSRPSVTACLIGPRTLQQLELILHSLELELSPEFLSQLDEVWPATGEGPEAYAW